MYKGGWFVVGCGGVWGRVATNYSVALTSLPSLQSSQGVPQMMVVSDLEDVFVPIVDGVLVSVEEAQQSIDR